ncbi:hypothetical protein LIER_30985 [Lithospermum erythrorhizon]|uniref:Uncharacterized protein n=1 Tax=Lithospermum erythrorhizon TaxID=34254 RepID=A0AAV3RT29_LITER
MINCNTVKTPFMAKAPSEASNSPLPNSHSYRYLVGALQYLAFTRSDITFAHQNVYTREKKAHREESKTQEEKETSAMSKTVKADAKYNNRREQNDDLHWLAMLLNGVEDKEKFLLKEYTTILKYYKDVRRKLNAVENKERNDHAEQMPKGMKKFNTYVAN